MFGRPTSRGTGALFSGIAGAFLQQMITRRVAGRAAGLAVRGGGGVPGLLVWIGVSYLINRFFNRASVSPAREAR